MKIESTRHICDITRKECQDMTDTEHSATLSFHFGYGSNLDGAHGELHLRRTAAGTGFDVGRSAFSGLARR
jgi:hypothetical protein